MALWPMALLCLGWLGVYAQSVDTVAPSPDLLSKIRQRADKLDRKLTRQSQKYLQQMADREERLKKELHKVDSVKAKAFFANAADRYRWDTAAHAGGGETYVSHLDTLQTTLKYWAEKGGVDAGSGGIGSAESSSGGIVGGGSGGAGLSSALGQTAGRLNTLQSDVNQSSLINQAISERRQQLSQYLSQYSQLPPGVTNAFNDYKTTAFYYRRQVEEVKSEINDPQKLEQKAIAQLSKLPAYQQFIARHSMLAALFHLPSGDDGAAALQGLQTKDQVQQIVQQQVAGGGSAGAAAVNQQMQQGQDQVSQMQNSLSKYGSSGQDMDMPDFKPNNQKTKTFLKRLSYGTNFQLSKSTNYFPATAAIGLSVGYKINDNGTAGVGVNYNLGLGKDWGHMAFSNQGIGLRSFMDWKLKKTWYAAGGYELNHLSAFSRIESLNDKGFWQSSALIGLEKKYRVSSKVQGNIQLLFDALYKQEQPAGQWLKFRVGYNFN